MNYLDVFRRAEGSDGFHTVQALARDSLLGFSGQKPVLVFLTDRDLFYGGSDAVRGRFVHVPLARIIELEEAGSSVLRSVRIVFESDSVEREVFFTPFQGDPGSPRMNEEGFARLTGLIRGYLEGQGVRI